jgi:hypothetical protein
MAKLGLPTGMCAALSSRPKPIKAGHRRYQFPTIAVSLTCITTTQQVYVHLILCDAFLRAFVPRGASRCHHPRRPYR